MRFLCDRMLVRLGKWLRAAGYDTVIAGPAEADDEILLRARGQARLLLTCDRRLKTEHARFDARVILLTSGAIDSAAMELTHRLGIDWHLAPFSRCLEDNAPLQPAGAREAARMPPSARELSGPVMACPGCRRIYWAGSHVERMRRRLASWQGL